MLTCLFGVAGCLGIMLIAISLSVLAGHGAWLSEDSSQVPTLATAWKMFGGGIFFLGIGVASWFLWGRHEDDGGDSRYSNWD